MHVKRLKKHERDRGGERVVDINFSKIKRIKFMEERIRKGRWKI